MQAETIIIFLSTKFDAEEQTGFTRLSKVPNTSVWRFLHYFRGLRTEEVRVLKRFLAKRAAGLFASLPVTVPPATEAEALAYQRCQKAIAGMGEYRFMSLKLLKMAVGYCRSDHPVAKTQLHGFQMPREVVKWVDGLSACKALELRRLVKAAFQTQFGLRPENHGGGVWLYRRPKGDFPFEVEVDYGGRWGQQLRYCVHVHEPRLGITFRRLTFENLLGVGGGDWDFITEAQASQMVELLTDLVEEVSEIPRHLVDRV